MDIKTYKNILTFIKTHKASGILGSGIFRFYYWQFITRVLKINKKKINWVNSSILMITKGRPTSTANYYVGVFDTLKVVQ